MVQFLHILRRYQMSPIFLRRTARKVAWAGSLIVSGILVGSLIGATTLLAIMATVLVLATMTDNFRGNMRTLLFLTYAIAVSTLFGCGDSVPSPATDPSTTSGVVQTTPQPDTQGSESGDPVCACNALIQCPDGQTCYDRKCSLPCEDADGWCPVCDPQDHE